MEQIVNISWRGPFSLKEVESLDDDASDYGLYQIYAHHPVYGRANRVVAMLRWRRPAQPFGHSDFNVKLMSQPLRWW